MTVLLPTRVSIYDFLIIDTKPIDSIIADAGAVSIPQAQILIKTSIQALVSALLAFHQKNGGEAVLKKLFQRSQVKELRKYNAFNLNTMAALTKFSQPVTDILFSTTSKQSVYEKLATTAHTSPLKVKPVLSSITLLCVRELAILADFSRLDANEIDIWFNHQSQFLRSSQRNIKVDITVNVNVTETETEKLLPIFNVPKYNDDWHELTQYIPSESQPYLSNSNESNTPNSIPHYAKVIGRVPQKQELSDSNLLDAERVSANITVIDENNSNDILTFASMNDINLPYQRWLLQLAKISDIYLSRNRLMIASEPKQAPIRPLVSFGFSEEKTVTTASEIPIMYDKPQPFWRNSAVLFILVVIGSLSLLAIGKYHYKQVNDLTLESNLDNIEERSNLSSGHSKDIAIVRIPDNDTSH